MFTSFSTSLSPLESALQIEDHLVLFHNAGYYGCCGGPWYVFNTCKSTVTPQDELTDHAAGALGLVTLKNLREEGFDAVGLDRNDYVGGLWHFDEGNKLTVMRSMYHSYTCLIFSLTRLA